MKPSIKTSKLSVLVHTWYRYRNQIATPLEFTLHKQFPKLCHRPAVDTNTESRHDVRQSNKYFGAWRLLHLPFSDADGILLRVFLVVAMAGSWLDRYWQVNRSDYKIVLSCRPEINRAPILNLMKQPIRMSLEQVLGEDNS